MLDLFKEYKELHGSNIMLSFKGEVSVDLVKSILDVVYERLDYIEDKAKLKKKIFNVLVEALQNLYRYAGTPDNYIINDMDSSRSVMLVIWLDEKGYHLATGNYIPQQKVEKLDAWLHEVEEHRQKGTLRDVRIKILADGDYTEGGGAGLGFVDMARKSGQKLEYNFHSVDDKMSFFEFQINIPKE